jgi:hypothetical protein
MNETLRRSLAYAPTPTSLESLSEANRMVGPAATHESGPQRAKAVREHRYRAFEDATFRASLRHRKQMKAGA